jgi:hypothetical protein
VAKSLSGHFGGGTITASTGLIGEPSIFGTAAEWMDYSGEMPLAAAEDERAAVTEGITLFDHPGNPSFPSKWHVREDGWMGPSACRDGGLAATRDQPLRLRYLLHIHRGGADAARAGAIAAAWRGESRLEVIKSMQPHRQYELRTVDG